MQQWRISVVILAALIGATLSGLLMFDHHGVGAAESAVEQICGADDTSGCNQVSQSRYSTLGGFSLGGVGLVYYSSLAFLGALALVAGESVRNAAAALAFGIVVAALAADLGLFAVQAFVIKAFCSLCLMTYGVNIVAALLLYPWSRKLHSIKTTLLGGEGSRAFAVWALGSLVFFVSILSFDRALASEAANPPPLLGSSTLPAPAPAPVPVPAPAPGPDPDPDPDPDPITNNDPAELAALETRLTAATAKIAELETTLSDPAKYQEYQLAQAQAEFDEEPVNDLSLDPSIPFKGPDDAVVHVVEFSDFLCPYCRNLAGAFSNYMSQSTDRVAIYFKNYPLDKDCNPALSRTVHEGACELALGAVCAHDQGKFWPYHDQVFSQPPPNATTDDVLRIATAAGLDADQMKTCLASPSASQTLTAQIEEAQRLEVRSTPTVFINGKRLAQIGGFLSAIQSELK